MKRILLALLLLASTFALTGATGSDVDVSKVFGKIRFTDRPDADFDVRVVDSGLPDLRVRIVDSLPVRPGQWEIVTTGEDFTVRFVDSLEDFTIEFVSVFEGVP